MRTKVLLYPAGGPTTYVASANASGAFSFDSVEPGKYRIGVERAGYRSEPGNQAGALTRLNPGQRIAGLELTAVPLGAISGNILDVEGEPLAGAKVEPFRAKWSHGRRVMVCVQLPGEFFHPVLTDDLGRYRLESLEAGEYFVRARPLSGWFNTEPVSDGPGQPEMAMIPTFYPGPRTIAGATPIRVGTGQDSAGIDLRLPMERAFHIRWTIRPAPTNAFSIKAPYVAASHDEGSERDWAEFVAQFGQDGSFDIAGLPAGAYVVQEEFGGVVLSDSVRAKVESNDVTGIRLTAGPRFDIEIQARFEGDPSHDLSRLYASLVPVDRTTADLSTQPRRPGVIENVALGRYILQVFPNENAFVKQLLVRGREVSDAEFEVDSAADWLEIVLDKGTRTIRGTFPWPEPRPVGASAILVPEQPRPGDFEIVHRADIDQKGEFVFRSVRPGRYRGFVATDFDEGLWENRDFVRLVADQGAVVNVPESVTDSPVVCVSPTLLSTAAVERAIARMGN